MLSTEDWNDFLKWEYETSARAPFFWLLTARSLLAGAERLYRLSNEGIKLTAELFYRDEQGIPRAHARSLSLEEQQSMRDVQLGPASLMLLGFCIENLCKGVIVRDHPEVVSGESGIGELRTHDLAHLVKRCHVATTPDQQEALSLLTQYTQWAGRYPVPAQALRKDESSPGQGFWVKARMKPQDWIWKEVRPIAVLLLQTLGDGNEPAA